jgi:hypothetical protein
LLAVRYVTFGKTWYWFAACAAHSADGGSWAKPGPANATNATARHITNQIFFIVNLRADYMDGRF